MDIGASLQIFIDTILRKNLISLALLSLRQWDIETHLATVLWLNVRPFWDFGTENLCAIVLVCRWSTLLHNVLCTLWEILHDFILGGVIHTFEVHGLVERMVCPGHRMPVPQPLPHELAGHALSGQDSSKDLISEVFYHLFVRGVYQLLSLLFCILNVIDWVKLHDLVCKGLNLWDKWILALINGALRVTSSDRMQINHLYEQN